MTELQSKSYILWFDWLGNKLLKWSQDKPTNKDLSNCVQAIGEIGLFVNQIRTENEVYKKRISLLRADKNNAVERSRKADSKIEELEKQITKLNIKL